MGRERARGDSYIFAVQGHEITLCEVPNNKFIAATAKSRPVGGESKGSGTAKHYLTDHFAGVGLPDVHDVYRQEPYSRGRGRGADPTIVRRERHGEPARRACVQNLSRVSIPGSNLV